MADDTNKAPRRKHRNIKNDLQAAGSQPTFAPRGEELNSKEIKRLEGFTGDAVKRLNYFTGQFLEATDFKDEQEYHIRMRRQLNLALRYPGVIDGLRVDVKQQATDALPAIIVVQEGLAIDAKGREIILLSPMEATKSKSDMDNFSGKTIGVYLSYYELFSDPQEASDVSSATRILEEPVITVTIDSDRPENSILLAEFPVNAGQFGNPTGTRDRSNSKFPYGLSIGSEAKDGIVGSRLIVGAIDGPKVYFPSPINDLLDVDLFLNTNTGKNVYVGAIEKGQRASLYVSGGVGIGTSKPQAKLHVDGDALITGNITLGKQSKITYAEGRAMKKILGGGEFHASQNENFNPLPLPVEYVGITDHGLNLNILYCTLENKNFISYHTNFNLPLNARIKTVRFCFRYTNNGIDKMQCYVALNKYRQNDIGWENGIPLLSSRIVELTLATGDFINEVFSPVITAEALDLTVRSDEEIFGIQILFGVNEINNQGSTCELGLFWVEISYDLFDTLNC